MKQDDPRPEAKPFEIPKRLIWEAWKRVAANKGAPGVDKESIEAYQNRLGQNLYTLWNRMSSGSYLPQPVRQVLIPKGDGQTRPLGIPTVNDRVAQMVVKMIVEPRLEPCFHPSSFGYRPGRNAHQAVNQARRNCWRYNWVLDMDMKAFFDTIDHDLMMRAIDKHVSEKWIRLYIRRWLESPVELVEGGLQERSCGTPQGGVITPLTQRITFIDLCRIVVGRRFRRLRFASRWRYLPWYRMFNRNQIFSYNYLFNQQSHNTLALTDIEGIGI